MPAVDHELTLRAAKGVADAYGDAVSELLRIVAGRLARGITDPGWAEAKLAETVELRRAAQVLVDRLVNDTPALVGDALDAGWTQGIRDAGDIGAGLATTNTAPLQALTRATVGDLTAMAPRILRTTVDAYRDIIATSTTMTTTGTMTRLQATQRALDRFADRGITGFVDRSGRRWELESYAEMATRTATGRAQVDATLGRLSANGRDLVIVSNAPEECKVCRPWEGKVLSISGADRRYPTVKEATSAGLLHANCFPGDVRVSGPPVGAADTRWYEGDLVVIHTAGGDELPVTPNHPVLTSEGWVPAGQLNPGDQLVRHLGAERMELVGPDKQAVPSLIGQVPGALREAGSVVTMRVPAAAEQFHGDGLGGDVDVVLADRSLGAGLDAAVSQPASDTPLVVGGVALRALLAERPPSEVLLGASHPTHGLMSGGNLSGTLLCRHSRPLPGLGLAAGDASTPNFDPAADRGLGDAEGGRELILALSGAVTLDEVIYLGRRQFAGHVYNLQTEGGWYTANGIVVHNCRHRLTAYIEGVTRPETTTADPEGDRARQEQRRLERGVRQWKRREAAAIDPDAERLAKAKAREWQARLRAHVEANDLKRRPERERLGGRVTDPDVTVSVDEQRRPDLPDRGRGRPTPGPVV